MDLNIGRPYDMKVSPTKDEIAREDKQAIDEAIDSGSLKLHNPLKGEPPEEEAEPPAE